MYNVVVCASTFLHKLDVDYRRDRATEARIPFKISLKRIISSEFELSLLRSRNANYPIKVARIPRAKCSVAPPPAGRWRYTVI